MKPMSKMFIEPVAGCAKYIALWGSMMFNPDLQSDSNSSDEGTICNNIHKQAFYSLRLTTVFYKKMMMSM